MEAFFQKYTDKLIGNSVLAENGQCRLWIDPSVLHKYGNVCYKHPGSGRWVSFCRPMRLSFMIYSRNVNLPRGFDCSHLCHNCRCINPQHISLEPHYINNHRLKCKNLGRCTKDHASYPDCRLDLTIEKNVRFIF